MSTRSTAWHDLVPLLFAHTAYKSYPQSFMDAGRWDRMGQWLQTLSTADVSNVDTEDVRDVDDWIDRLRAAGHMVMATSGTTGKVSFLNHTRARLRAEAPPLPPDDRLAAPAGRQQPRGLLCGPELGRELGDRVLSQQRRRLGPAGGRPLPHRRAAAPVGHQRHGGAEAPHGARGPQRRARSRRPSARPRPRASG